MNPSWLSNSRRSTYPPSQTQTILGKPWIGPAWHLAAHRLLPEDGQGASALGGKLRSQPVCSGTEGMFQTVPVARGHEAMGSSGFPPEIHPRLTRGVEEIESGP